MGAPAARGGMADDWEDDWENEGFQVPQVGGGPAEAAAAAGPAPGKFDDEDEEDDSLERAAAEAKAKAEGSVRQKKKDAAPAQSNANALSEEDLKAFQKLLGGAADGLDKVELKSPAECAAYGRGLAAKFLAPRSGTGELRNILSGLLKGALAQSSVGEIKAVETDVVALRNERMREEKAATAAAKKGKKGKAGLNAKGAEGGIGDYYDSQTALDMDDDVDFM